MKRIALAFIVFYQRFVSPYKGFKCAYHVHTGGPNCSAYGYEVVQRHGFRIGLGLIRKRLKECGRVYREHRPACEHEKRVWGFRHKQAGFCDADCDFGACDVGDFSSCADGCDACDSCDLGDWFGGGKGKLKSKQSGEGHEPIEPSDSTAV